MDGEIVIRSLDPLARDAHSYYRVAFAIIIFISKQRLGVTTRPAVLDAAGRAPPSLSWAPSKFSTAHCPSPQRAPFCSWPRDPRPPRFPPTASAESSQPPPVVGASQTQTLSVWSPRGSALTPPLSLCSVSSTLFPYSYLVRVLKLGTSLVLLWVRSYNANNAGSIPGRGAEISISRATGRQRPCCNC